jgi:hypothetical protein
MDKYVRNVQASVASGKRARALNNADPGVWKTNALNIGAPGLGTGAQKAKSKMLNRMNFMAPVYNQASQAAAAIPDDGNMNLQKVAAAIQVMRSAVGKG